MRPRIRGAVLALTTAFMLLPAQGVAQEVTVRYRTKVDLGGALGQMMRLVPGMGRVLAPQEEVVRVKGSLLRSDEGESSTIVDAGAGRLIHLDHDQRSYTVMTAADMAEMMGEVRDQVEGAMEEARAQQPQAGDEPQVKVTARVESRVTGQRQNIGGVDAEQVHLIVYMDFEGEQDSEVIQGTMVVFTDVWTTRGGPAPEVEEVWRTWAENFVGAEDFRESAEGLQQVFAADPRIQVAMEQNREALEAMEGTAVKTTTMMVTVMPGATFDPALAVADMERELGVDVGAIAGAAARDAAAGAARGALSGATRGILGRRQAEPAPAPEPEAEPVTQVTILRTVQELVSVDRGPVPGDIFTPPANYREIDWRAQMRGAR